MEGLGMAYNDYIMSALSSSTSKLIDQWSVPGSDILQTSRRSKMSTDFWQVRVFYNRQIEVKKLFNRKKLVAAPFEYASNIVNRTKNEALGYAPYYIAQLIKSGDLPAEAVVNGQINEKLIGVRVVKLDIALMERNVENK